MRISTRTMSALSSSMVLVTCSSGPEYDDLRPSSHPARANRAKPASRILPLMPRRYGFRAGNVPEKFSNPEGVRSPALDGGFDLLGVPLAVERLLPQASHFAVGSKAQRNELLFV